MLQTHNPIGECVAVAEASLVRFDALQQRELLWVIGANADACSDCR
jgi:hypothetical protein